MRNFLYSFSIALLGLLAHPASAADYTTGNLRISSPWARATAPGAKAGGAFVTITNTGPADRLIRAQGGVAQSVELHSMVMDGNIMRMNKLDHGIDLPAGQGVELKPGGLHIMLVDLKAPLKAGEHFPLKLSFEKAGDITVDVEVAALGASGPASHAAEASAAPAMQHMHMP